MRLVLIVLLLAACAPIGTGQTVVGASANTDPGALTAAARAAAPAGSGAAAVQPDSAPEELQPGKASSAPSSGATRPPEIAPMQGALQPRKPTRPPNSGTTRPQEFAPVLDQISTARLRADLLALEAFYTRHSASDISLNSGEVGSARAWLFEQLRDISPRLQVEADNFVFPFGNRPTAAQNIIATLPGRANPSQVIIISAHYDSRTVNIADARSAAPGANDDGSGVAAVLELARTLSTQSLDATFKFILFAGEEEGLFGSEHLAPVMRKQGLRIIAMLDNDIIGNVTGPDGQRVDNRVRVFSGDPDSGPARQLAREAKTIVEGTLPGFGVELVAALDRAGRGGDQIPFYYAGCPSIRFTEAVENLQHQHGPGDRVEFMDMTYLASVVRANLTVALALGKTISG